MAEERNQHDNDFQSAAADRVLRARDIIPSTKTGLTAGHVQRDSSVNADIPKFDLARQILAEQRKVAATKRKGPAAQSEEQTAVLPASRRAGPIPVIAPASSPYDSLIAEIVAADIESAAADRGDYSVYMR